MEYKEKDVILWNNDKRLKDGDFYYAGTSANDLLKRVKSDYPPIPRKLISHNKCGGFEIQMDEGKRVFVPCLVKAEDNIDHLKSGYIPFDLNAESDRRKLYNKWVKRGGDFPCVSFITDFYYVGGEWLVRINTVPYTAGELLEKFVFEESSLPVGKKIEGGDVCKTFCNTFV